TRGEIIHAIKTKGLTLIDEVSDETEAGTGCSSCHDDIETILKEING
ncbi:MAG: (2Fe-2S)-binding protein, partial [Acidobacteria bacterium]